MADVAWAPPVGSPPARALAHVAAHDAGNAPVDPAVRITLNFHPDRLHRGVPILRALARDGVYRSQFETGTSNGGLTAHPGGDRWAWESRLFGRAYDDAPPAERPKYGALDFGRRSTGGSPRFGSAHLRLRPAVLDRSTFCYPDSCFDPVHVAVAAGAGALVALAEDGTAGDPDPLNAYVEAHVHGPLVLACDVEALVLDPCYRGTEVEALAGALPCAVEWHAGFRLDAATLARHASYRGPAFVALGLALAEDGHLTPDHLGRAARAGHHDPQALKRVWHYLACFGDPARDPTT